jgi:hypothetical protein
MEAKLNTIRRLKTSQLKIILTVSTISLCGALLFASSCKTRSNSLSLEDEGASLNASCPSLVSLKNRFLPSAKNATCGLLAALVVSQSAMGASPALADELTLPDALIPEYEQVCDYPSGADKGEDVTFTKYVIDQVSAFANQANPDAAASLKKLNIPCELPMNVRKAAPGVDLDMMRLRAARVYMAHLTFAAGFLPEQRIAIPTRYLYHYLKGSGNQNEFGPPKEIKEKEMLSNLAAIFTAKWLQHPDHPENGRFFFTYDDYQTLSQGAKVGYEWAAASNTIGQHYQYFRTKEGADASGSEGWWVTIGVNDEYIWPKKFQNQEWVFPKNEMPSKEAIVGLRAILGEQNSTKYLKGNAISAEFWNDLRTVGAAPFRMEGCHEFFIPKAKLGEVAKFDPSKNVDPVNAPDAVPEVPPLPSLPSFQFPKVQLPNVQLPRIELSKIQLPEMNLPKVDLSKVQLPKVELPNVQIPKVDLSKVKLPKFEMPPIPEMPKCFFSKKK